MADSDNVGTNFTFWTDSEYWSQTNINLTDPIRGLDGFLHARGVFNIGNNDVISSQPVYGKPLTRNGLQFIEPYNFQHLYEPHSLVAPNPSATNQAHPYGLHNGFTYDVTAYGTETPNYFGS